MIGNLEKPYGIDDLSYFENLSIKTDEYYPFSKENNAILDEKVVSFMLRLGYVFDYSDMGWYQLNADGLYSPISEDLVKRDILHFLVKRKPSGINTIPVKSRDAILEHLRVVSYPRSCEEKYEEFLLNHEEYQIPPLYDDADIMGTSLIPVRNGLINPVTMDILPHCAYLLHHNVYNFDYEKMTEEDILCHPAYDTYAGIIPDKPTLEFYLWWVGAVLFSSDLPRIILFLYGDAGTGKTTLSLGLSKILTTKKALQLNANMLNSRFVTSSFEDKQLIVIDEMSNSAGLMDDAFIKQLTGGTPYFTVERKYQDPRNVRLMSKLLFIGNSYPSLIQDNAIRDRMFIIPCNNPQDSIVRKLVVADDHLNWLFNAAYFYYAVKQPHKQVKSLSELKTPLMLEELSHYCDTDAFTNWIKDYLGIDEISKDIVQQLLNHTPSKDVYEHYKNYLLDNGAKPQSVMKFNARLRQDYDLEKVTIRDGLRTFKGYRIASEGGYE